MTEAVSIRSDGTVVLAGLQWEVSEDGFGPTQIRVLAKAAKHAGYLLRANERNIAFLPSTFAGKDVVSIAALVADAIAGAFAGVFRIDESWIYVASTEAGYILADGDRVYSTADAARARLLEERNLFAVIYGPADWQIEGALDADALLEKVDWTNAERFQLLAVEKDGHRKALIAGAVSLSVLAACGMGWRYWSSDDMTDEAAAPVAAPAPPPMPWLSEVRPESAASACLAARAAVSEATHQGWRLADMTCDIAGRTVTATLTPYTLASELPVLAPGYRAQLAPDAATMIVSGSLQIPPPNRRSEMPSAANTLGFRNFLFGLGGKPAWQAAGTRVQFDISTSLPIQIVANGMRDFQTVSVIRLDYLGDKWRVQGTIAN